MTSNSSFSLIITQLHEQDGNREMGPFLLAFYYVSYMLSNIISPSLKWNYKSQMQLAPVFYTLNFCTGLLVSYIDSLILKYIVTAIGALVGGFGAAILWTSLGGYMHLLCQVNNV